MADQRISELTTVTPATGDMVEIVDISDTTDNAAGSSKKVEISAISASLLAGSTQSANTFLAGPSSGSPAAPAFRTFTLDDIPGNTAVGRNFITLANPSAIAFPRINANNTISALTAADFRAAIGAGTGNGTVTNVSVATANGFSGTVDTSTTTPVITIVAGAITPNKISIGTDAAPHAINLATGARITWRDFTNTASLEWIYTTNDGVLDYLVAGNFTMTNTGITILLGALYGGESGEITVYDGYKVTIAGGGTGANNAAGAFNNLSPITTKGDIIYGSAANTSSRLAGNTSATMAVLTQTGTGTASNAPAWTPTTGTGDVVRATSPTLVTPALGTPASGTLTNCTGYPYSNLSGKPWDFETALAADFSVTNQTLQDVTGCSFSANSGESWEVEINGATTTDANADCAIALLTTGTWGTGQSWSEGVHFNGAGTVTNRTATAFSSSTISTTSPGLTINGDTTVRPFRLRYCFTMTGTGTVKAQFGNAAIGVGRVSTLKSGATMRARKVG